MYSFSPINFAILKLKLRTFAGIPVLASAPFKRPRPIEGVIRLPKGMLIRTTSCSLLMLRLLFGPGINEFGLVRVIQFTAGCACVLRGNYTEHPNGVCRRADRY